MATASVGAVRAIVSGIGWCARTHSFRFRADGPRRSPGSAKHLNSSQWKRNSLQANCKTRIDLHSTKKPVRTSRAGSEPQSVHRRSPCTDLTWLPQPPRVFTWTPLLTGLPPVRMAASFAAPGSPLLRPAELLAFLAGDFYFRAFNGLVTLPVAEYDYGGNWTIPPAGLPPAGSAASVAAPVPGFHCAFLPDMPSSMTSGSSIVVSVQNTDVDIGLRHGPKNSALPIVPQSVSRGARFSRLHWFATATACQVAGPPVRI